MKNGLIIGGFALLCAPLLWGCAQNGETDATRQVQPAHIETFAAGKSGRFAKITVPSDAPPTIRPSDRPPPRKILVRDLVTGAGRAARTGDQVTIFYYSVNYRTGKRTYFRWPPQPALELQLAETTWEQALVGMRPGGLREVIVPSHLLFGTGTVDYIFELVRVGRKA
jgi:FKBP-type peptidyl-prolyl isomerase-like protein